MAIVFTCVIVIRPLTAEEISRRREALKQRLAEKEQSVSINASADAARELPNGNLDKLLRRVIVKIFGTV